VAPNSGRVSAIDTAKGIGIVLVVYGHIVGPDLGPLGNEWWPITNHYLYSFHMAFFFFLAGYVFFLRPPGQWVPRVRKSAAKLIPAYFVFVVIVFVAKATAVSFLHVDRPVRDPMSEFLTMITYPLSGFAQYLWFIFCLLQVYGLMLILRAWMPKYFSVAIVIAFGLHLMAVTGHVTQFLALQQTARYWLFFLMAGACYRYPEVWHTWITRYGLAFFAAFAFALIALPKSWLPTAAGLLCVPALVGLAVQFERWPLVRAPLQFLGRNTLTIYLMSALAMGLVRAIVIRTWGWDGWHFFVVAPVLLASGLLLPIVAQRLIFARWSWTDRITR
jgi:fucose 4-O-acetylase-like acetyltransferase